MDRFERCRTIEVENNVSVSQQLGVAEPDAVVVV